MPQRNVFSWTAMISAYAKNRQYKEALALFQKMHQAGTEPDEVACIIALKACTKIAALEQGQHLHSLILKKGYAREGLGKEALDLYEQMKYEDMEPDNITLVLLLKACASISALHQGKQLHSIILQKGLELELSIQSTLVDMYSKCGSIKDARELFDNMNKRDVVSWTAMISGYSQKCLGKEALDLYEQMKYEGLEPDNITVLVLLKACASISALQQGKELHSLILEKNLESGLIVQTTLLDMYSKCGCLKYAREVFDSMTERNVVSWTAMIAGYVHQGLGKEAFDLYEQMKREAVEPNDITLVLLLKACATISGLHQGKQLHSFVLRKGLESELIFQTTLVNMYAKCRCLNAARELFDSMTVRNVVSWTAMIAGYVEEGLGKEALSLYQQMKHELVEPDNITLGLLLKACAGISALQQGKQLHSLIVEKGLESELIIQTNLIDMYIRCGCLKDARKLFDMMPERNVVSWTAMIAGYAKQGLGKEALDLFEQMKNEGLQANEVTYSCILAACSHSGLVAEGCQVFDSLYKGTNVTPTLEHYAAMVDLLGKVVP